MLSDKSKVYVAGHSGMVGSAMVRRLQRAGVRKIIQRTSKELDLTRQAEVEEFLLGEKPDCVILAAARVGGILANNSYRAEFIYENLQIQANVIHSSWKAGVRNLLFLSSSCVFPRDCPQPMKEEYLWTGPLESTNEPFAVAKLAGFSMCRAYNDQYGTRYLSIIAPNLYGPNDNFDPQQSHLLSALIYKFHQAKSNGDAEVVLWGSGTPRRELMHVDEAVDAALFVLQCPDVTGIINVGVGCDDTVEEIAELVRASVGYAGRIRFDASKPDGAPRKVVDVARLAALGWKSRVSLEDGIAQTYAWYLKSLESRVHPPHRVQ